MQIKISVRLKNSNFQTISKMTLNLRQTLLIVIISIQIIQTLGEDILDAKAKEMIEKNCEVNAVNRMTQCIDDLNEDTKQLMLDEKKDWVDLILSHACCQYYDVMECFNKTKADDKCNATLDVYLGKRFHIPVVESICGTYRTASGTCVDWYIILIWVLVVIAIIILIIVIICCVLCWFFCSK